MIGSKVKAGDIMGIFRRSIKNETKTITLQELNEYFENTNILSALGKSNLTAATYYACMQIRCNAIAKVPFKVYKRYGDGSQEIQHDLNELLKLRPNPFMSAHDMLWATEYQRLGFGNAFWVYGFDSGKITAIYLLDSTQVEIIVDDKGILNKPNSVYYLYNDYKKGQIIYPANRILHFKHYSTDGIKGNSIQRYLSDVILQEKYAQEVIKERYSKGLQDPIIVTYTGDLNDSRSQAIKKKFANLGGAQNAGMVVPIPTDFKVDQLETKLVNSQFFELNGLTTRHIANAFGVKSFQLNDMEKSTYSNIENQNRAFYSETMQNTLTSYEQEMTYKLISDFERKEGCDIKGNADVYLRADIEARYTAYSKGISGGFLQIAEARKKENLPFIEGTDKLIIGNGSSVPLDMLGIQYSKGNKGNDQI